MQSRGMTVEYDFRCTPRLVLAKAPRLCVTKKACRCAKDADIKSRMALDTKRYKNTGQVELQRTSIAVTLIKTEVRHLARFLPIGTRPGMGHQPTEPRSGRNSMFTRIITAIAVLVFPLLTVVAQEETKPVAARVHGDEAKAAKLDIGVLLELDTALQKQVDDNHVSGVIGLIARHGKIG
jgi:hypothetical protein